ncbi:hypothetical protein ACU8KH_01526 [Lachancea thermotolerans]
MSLRYCISLQQHDLRYALTPFRCHPIIFGFLLLLKPHNELGIPISFRWLACQVWFGKSTTQTKLFLTQFAIIDVLRAHL